MSSKKEGAKPMIKRIVVCLLTTALLSIAPFAEAQQPKKVARIGYLSTQEPARESTPFQSIRLALRELGYVEGQNIASEYRYAEGKRDRYPELSAELVRLKVDIIVAAGGDTMVRAAKNATKTIPIVMVGLSGDPVETGLVDSLARPGGNVTVEQPMRFELVINLITAKKTGVTIDPNVLARAKEVIR